ncbi:MAG: signal peptide peptidase SppA, partial [Prevotella sp.]
NPEQVTAYLNGIWTVMLKEVGESRKISVDSLNAYADRNMAFAAADDYVKLKLVDGIMYANEVKKEIKKRLNLKDDEEIPQMSLADMTGAEGKEQKGDEIAVYYAYGDIVDGAPDGISGSSYIASDNVCRELDELAADDDVKAVVLRVNSGGGSAYASEQIWHSVMNLKAKKPVVVSMGGLAASGGYYISCAANYIFAEPTTLTGSIGIFGMFPDFSGLLTEKLGVKFDEVKTNKHSAFGSPARPFNDEEIEILNTYIDRNYSLFRKRVADGRGMTTDAVEAVAQGRVWIGSDALEKKLVDGMGGIGKAVEKAAQLAKLKEYKTVSYPEKPGFFERLLNDVSPKNNLDESMQETLGEYYKPFTLMKNINHHDAIQARMPYVITIK